MALKTNVWVKRKNVATEVFEHLVHSSLFMVSIPSNNLSAIIRLLVTASIYWVGN